MNELAAFLIEAHGGLDRWRTCESVSADLEQSGALWALKGHPDTLARTRVTVGLRSEWASHHPFGTEGLRSRFAQYRVALERADGTLVDALASPRRSFEGHDLTTPWSPLQLAYFAGCAMWTYLNMPFLLAWPGVDSEEVEPWTQGGEAWRRLRIHLPPDIATHSVVQTLYVGPDGLLRRHDYDVEITGGTPGAHMIDHYVSVSGLLFPTRRRIYPRQPDGTVAAEPLVVSIDLSNIALQSR